MARDAKGSVVDFPFTVLERGRTNLGTANGNSSCARQSFCLARRASPCQGEDGPAVLRGEVAAGAAVVVAGQRASGVPDRATGRSEVPTPSGEAGMSLHERPLDVPTFLVGNPRERVGDEPGPRPRGRVDAGAVVAASQ